MHSAVRWRQWIAAPSAAAALVPLVVYHRLLPHADHRTAARCLRHPPMSPPTLVCLASAQPADFSAIVARITSFLVAAAPAVPLPVPALMTVSVPASTATSHDGRALTMQPPSSLHPAAASTSPAAAQPAQPSAQSGVVAFYEVTDAPYGCFSNYYLCSIRVHGLLYPSVEHYYQSHKFSSQHAEYRELIRQASTANKAKILARQQTAIGYKWRTDLNPLIEKHLRLGVRMRDDWEEQKDAVMFSGLQAKFDQNPQLALLLLSTGDRGIVEQSPRDWYWGCGKDGSGKNKLGYLLMNVRGYLRKKQLLLMKRKRDTAGGE